MSAYTSTYRSHTKPTPTSNQADTSASTTSWETPPRDPDYKGWKPSDAMLKELNAQFDELDLAEFGWCVPRGQVAIAAAAAAAAAAAESKKKAKGHASSDSISSSSSESESSSSSSSESGSSDSTANSSVSSASSDSTAASIVSSASEASTYASSTSWETPALDPDYKGWRPDEETLNILLKQLDELNVKEFGFRTPPGKGKGKGKSVRRGPEEV